LQRAATFLVLLLAALVFPSILGGAVELQDDSPPALLEWPMLPGESLQQLARLIYPHDRAMQRHFIDAAKRENPGIFGQHAPNQRFDQETLIWLPDLKQLSRLAAPPKPARQILRPVPAAIEPSRPVQPPASRQVVISRGAVESAMLEELSARYLSLKEQQLALEIRLATLEANVAQVGEMIAQPQAKEPQVTEPRIKEPQVKKGRKVATSTPLPQPAGKVSLLPVSPLHLLALGAVILVGGGLLWLRRRRKPVSILPAPVPARQPRIAEEAVPAPEQPQPSKQSMESHVDESAILVDEISSVVEEAKVFVALGRSEHAVEVLEYYIATHPQASPNPWLYLLEIHRGANREEEFTALAKRFHQTFNVMAPQWEDSTQAQMVVPHSLEEFPHIIARLVDGWGTLDGQDYLNSLLQDNRSGERAGFSMEVLQEILMLLAVMEMRDHAPPLQPF